ncbi:reverse transcriptase [Lasius niger]|uniref:Reverse transcriptase n=1 Tax=Lasius niger TaxID=67767 RepID=A0A0J7N1B2_LASNI|nr:reverse transcriptase [Lasius niger]
MTLCSILKHWEIDLFPEATTNNAKHPQWGSRLLSPKGRELHKAMEYLKLDSVSTGKPTYWPTDKRKIPDTIDFYITKNISKRYLKTKSCLELSSDHSPVLLTLSSKVLEKEKPCIFSNKRTDWEYFRLQVEETLNTSIPLKTEYEITESIEHFNQCIQQAAWNATPLNSAKDSVNESSVPVRLKVAEKRKLRKQWQTTRFPELKAKLNKVTKSLRKMLNSERNQGIQEYLQNLSATQASDYTLWKATKRLKQPEILITPVRSPDGKWARSANEKADAFAQHLAEVFTPHPDAAQSEEEEDEIYRALNEPYQLELPLHNFKKNEVIKIIQNNLNPKKASGYNLITGQILQNLPEKGWKFLTQLFNAILRTSFFPLQWKVSQIILILKPGKKPEDVKSYRPISLLPILSKVFEKLLLSRLRPIIEEKGLIPNHQFGFRHKHASIEQAHRIYKKKYIQA